MKPFVVAVSVSPEHTFSKPNVPSIKLIAGIGVEGDAHAGKLVKHRFLVGKDPTKPNIRQIHLIQAELFDEVARKGFHVNPGDIGENITTRGIDLPHLPAGTILSIGEDVVIQVTALRNPCHQIDSFQKGLLKEMFFINEKGKKLGKTGVMGIVLTGGVVKPDDLILIALPPQPYQLLDYIW